MPADQMSCSTTGTPVVDPLLECSPHAVVAGKSQIVVAAEVQHLTTIDLQNSALGTFNNAPPAIAILSLLLLEASSDVTKTGQIDRTTLRIAANAVAQRLPPEAMVILHRQP